MKSTNAPICPSLLEPRSLGMNRATRKFRQWMPFYHSENQTCWGKWKWRANHLAGSRWKRKRTHATFCSGAVQEETKKHKDTLLADTRPLSEVENSGIEQVQDSDEEADKEETRQTQTASPRHEPVPTSPRDTNSTTTDRKPEDPSPSTSSGIRRETPRTEQETRVFKHSLPKTPKEKKAGTLS